MKRLTVDALEALAFAHNAPMEVIPANILAVVTVGGIDYYAELKPAVGRGAA